MRLAGAIVLGLMAFRAGPQEGEAATVRARLTAYLETSDPKSADKAFEELLASYAAVGQGDLKSALRTDILAALRGVREKRLKAIDSKVKSLASLKALAAAKIELNRRREAAIKAIFDPALYLPEAHADWKKGDAANGQAKVDALVLKAHPGSVEEFWSKSTPVELDLTALADAEALQDLNAKQLPALGEKAEPEDLELARLLLSNPHPKLDLRSFALDSGEAETLSWNARVEAYHAALVDPDVGPAEKEHAAVINAYREMMGRRKLFLEARLCRATKKHSAACDAAKKIWHDGPDGSAQSRAREQGFPEAVGENVAISFAHPAELWWKGWFRASDHHRNALSDKWTCMGYGYVGIVGTQNFSTLPTPKTFPPK